MQSLDFSRKIINKDDNLIEFCQEEGVNNIDFSQKKSVSGLLSLISICSLTRHFNAVEHHLTEVATWLTKEK